MEKKEIAKNILKRLMNQGYQAYFVGGYVRDQLLNRPTTDIDIATDAKPEAILSLFEKAVPTGLKHGTVTVIEQGLSIEITTFRKEGKYLDYRHPKEVKFVTNLYDDLSRRDFTMNAIALDYYEQLIDPFNGQSAIVNRNIESVGNPNERFMEDPLRMMRAVRFAAQLQFQIEKNTLRAIRELAFYLQYISIERVKIELDKIINANHPEIGIELLYSLELIRWFKGMIDGPLYFIDHGKVLQTINQTMDPFVRWSILFEQLNSTERNRVMDGLRFSNKEKQTILNIFKAYSIIQKGQKIEELKKCFIETNEDDCLKSLELSYLLGYIQKKELLEWKLTLSELNKQLMVRTLKDLKVSGKDVLEIVKQPPGPWIHDLLQELFHQVVFDGLPNHREILLQRIENLKEKVFDEGED
ncbi:CCA tRNA nucleotidyltransferase [Tepidibacillus fermentans]|uniref:tRNA nucleotidyltransferase (CCA-adding enzyme) n=1 Tax=Tepidibacillus fermentans TaxID=1281767 RepID=A0A4V6NZ09_9BACI|nr:CCA tRNA nucleotidyltransferase [Tepidibacillus fermentans]TCS84159.1 tRNA nucleotidyltransferase (CCA-adding enzyme) [Tepidibacillus fermentans]